MESMYENSAVISVLGAARESVVGDESTSMPRQIQSIERWAAERTDYTGKRHHIVKITEDPDTSGAMSPFNRPGLGPYLRRPLLDTWKVLVVPSLDRLTRSLDDFLDIWTLLETEGKGLVSRWDELRMLGRTAPYQVYMLTVTSMEAGAATLTSNGYRAGSGAVIA